jgi:uncharacterized surface protein with fasciclin (FAS1) repeats
MLLLAACQPIQPPAGASAAPTPAPAQSEAAPVDIVDTAVAAGSFTTLVTAVEAAGLVETLKGEGPFTVFAPTDDAFAALPAGTLDELLNDPTGQLSQILLYHVVPGKVMAADVADGLEAATAQGANVTFSAKDGAVMINDATIVTTDIEASNGVIHVIDAVILPPAEAAAEEPAAEMADIVDTAVAAGNFTTLVAAVEAAGLVETLKGEGPFTVFAPSDEAFAALPAGTLDTLLQDPQGQLSQILLYHVVPGKVMAADVAGLDGQTAETAGGKLLNIKLDGDQVMINDALVVTADIATANGVIHVIDKVLVPAE